MKEYRITFENGKTVWYSGGYIDALDYAESMKNVYGEFTIEDSEDDED